MKKRFKILLCTVCVLVLYVSIIGVKRADSNLGKTNVKNTNLLSDTNGDYSANLVAQYKMDDTLGTTCVDSKGNNNGTYNGTASVTENGNTFRRFNGTSDYVSFTNKIIPMHKYSIKFKVRTSKTGVYQFIIDNRRYNSDYTHIYGNTICITDLGKLNWQITDDQGQRLFNMKSENAINDGKWHTILVEKTDSIAKMFIDDLQTPCNTVNPTIQETTGDNYDTLVFGAERDVTPNPFQQLFLSGDLDDVEIYNDIVDYTVKPKSISLNRTTDTVEVGGTISDLVATVLPEDTTNKTVKWTSSDESIATVDENGKVTAGSKAGTVTITATTEDGGLTATCVITVKEKEVPPTGDRAVLTITMSNNERKEYDLSADEIKKFIDWYNGNSSPSYAINKNYNVQPFNSRTEYIAHDKVSSFEVNQYTSTTK